MGREHQGALPQGGHQPARHGGAVAEGAEQHGECEPSRPRRGQPTNRRMPVLWIDIARARAAQMEMVLVAMLFNLYTLHDLRIRVTLFQLSYLTFFECVSTLYFAISCSAMSLKIVS